MNGPEHGARARYARGCRCAPCTQANRTAENQRTRLIAYGQWQPYVDAERAREHVRMLAAHGIGWKRAAELTGVSTGSMSKLLYGGPGDRPPSQRIRPETEAKILAVRPSLELLGARADVDATGTHRRVQALVACGWSQLKLAERLGMLRSNFGTMMNNAKVHAGTARAVGALYDELWDQAPPEAEWRDKIAASRSRNYAAARGWAPPAAWDDIDDPDASPADGWRRGPDKPLRGAELAAEARELFSLGFSLDEATGRLGVSRDTLQSALRRNPETGESEAA
jgi:transcriptional regulator with XRE-family HTH domain